MDLIKSIAVFLGTVIGVGIFSLPFVAMKAGFFVAVIYLFLMAFISYKIHGFYADIVLKTEGSHRLPGYSYKYLGLGWKNIAFAVISAGFVCSLLAYLIVGSQFLFNAFSPIAGGNYFAYFLVFFILGVFTVFREIKIISKIELLLLAIIILILLYVFLISLPRIDASNFESFDINNIFFPYGVVIFSLWGASVIPDLKEMIVGKQAAMIIKKTIKWGVIISFLAYLIFIFSVLGVTGQKTSQEAISGLKGFFGQNIVQICSIFGFLCCFTSYITIGLVFKKSLQYDFKVSSFFSWLLIAFVPFLLYLLGAREFIKIIGFTGTIAIGMEAIIIIFIYQACFKREISANAKLFSSILALVFGLGILLEIVYFLI